MRAAPPALPFREQRERRPRPPAPPAGAILLSLAAALCAAEPASAVAAAPATVEPVELGQVPAGLGLGPLDRFRLFAGVGLVDPRLTLEALGARRAGKPRPLVAGRLEAAARRSLLAAFPAALDRLAALPACRDLYLQLGTDGLVLLTTTVYIGPVSSALSRECARRSANAYTGIGHHTTVICPAFARLQERRAAVTLLHEALHYAGMTESPEDQAALTSPQISSLVSERCGL